MNAHKNMGISVFDRILIYLRGRTRNYKQWRVMVTDDA